MRADIAVRRAALATIDPQGVAVLWLARESFSVCVHTHTLLGHPQVDTHIHHSACMHQKHLLRFIKSKLRKEPDEVVIFRDGKYLTLREVGGWVAEVGWGAAAWTRAWRMQCHHGLDCGDFESMLTGIAAQLMPATP
jgi:hypothetical protein